MNTTQNELPLHKLIAREVSNASYIARYYLVKQATWLKCYENVNR